MQCLVAYFLLERKDSRVRGAKDYAKEGEFDLLVIGFMGHSKIFGRVWGSTSQNITKLSPCTVVVVK